MSRTMTDDASAYWEGFWPKNRVCSCQHCCVTRAEQALAAAEKPAAWRDASGALHVNSISEVASPWGDAPNSVTGGQCLDVDPQAEWNRIQSRRIEADIDTLFGRVFATPDGAVLLEHLRARGRSLCNEIDERLARQRRRWERGPHNWSDEA